MNLMENGDEWLAQDKLEHVIFCFSISILFSLLASLTPLRRRRILIGSLASSAAGAAKELADHLGFFRSSGASAKDAAADLLGILLAAVFLKLFNPLLFRVRPDRPGSDLGVGMV